MANKLETKGSQIREEDKKGKKSAKVAPAESVVPPKSKHATRMGKLRNFFRAKTRIEEPVAKTQKTKPITVYPCEDAVSCVDYSKDGRWLACATAKKVIVRHVKTNAVRCVLSIKDSSVHMQFLTEW